MIYIYDIMLNFNKDYYEFYEWKKKDKIINVKKIPAYRTNSSLLKKIKYNNIKVDSAFLSGIMDLTVLYNKKSYSYMCLFSDGDESVGVMFDKDGNLIKRSSLLIDEEEEVNDELKFENDFDINVLEEHENEIELLSRIDREIYDYLVKFVYCLDNELIIKYLYYDLFEIEGINIDDMKNKLLTNIKDCDFAFRMYELVKIFKKIKN